VVNVNGPRVGLSRNVAKRGELARPIPARVDRLVLPPLVLLAQPRRQGSMMKSFPVSGTWVGGVASVSPSLREVPLEDQRSAIDFAHRLLIGKIGIVIFQTGVGFRQLLEIVQRHVVAGYLRKRIGEISRPL
jgi:hypothetical protein